MAKESTKKPTTRKTSLKIEPRQGCCFMKNKQGVQVQVKDKPEHVDLLESKGWTRV